MMSLVVVGFLFVSTVVACVSRTTVAGGGLERDGSLGWWWCRCRLVVVTFLVVAGVSYITVDCGGEETASGGVLITHV